LKPGLGSHSIGGVGWSPRAEAQADVPRSGELRWGAIGDDAPVRLAKAPTAAGRRNGRTFTTQWRFATNGQGARRAAAALAGRTLDRVIASATPAAVELRGAMPSEPTVSAGVADPVGACRAAPLARHGGNIAGVKINLPVPGAGTCTGCVVSVPACSAPPPSDRPMPRHQDLGRAGADRCVHAECKDAFALISQATKDPSALGAMLRNRAQAMVVPPPFAFSDSGPPADLPAWRERLSMKARRASSKAGGSASDGLPAPNAGIRPHRQLCATNGARRHAGRRAGGRAEHLRTGPEADKRDGLGARGAAVCAVAC